jgi:transglutaminase-like putative cysteine protease
MPATGKSGHFNANHNFEIAVPEGCTNLRAWLPIPSRTDPHQTVTNLQVNSAVSSQIVADAVGNEFLFVEAVKPAPGKLLVGTSFTIDRKEVNGTVDPSKTRPLTPEELTAHSKELMPGSQSVIDADVRSMAHRLVGTEKNPVRQAHLLYNGVLDHVEYHVKDPKPDAEKTMNASGTGSSHYTYEKRCGNCTDFHSLYAALARHVGLPIREVYGSFFKSPLTGMDKDQSYHCWIEFYAPNLGWIPLDVAVADVFVRDFHANENSRPRAALTTADGYNGPDPYLVDYYFGNIEERRVVWHRGRDLVMNPPQAGSPLLWNATGYAEANGKPTKVARKLTFTNAL